MNRKERRTVTTTEGGLVYEQEYRGNKIDGLSNVYKNGILVASADFKKGVLHGVSKLYTDEGLFREYALFRNDRKDGLCISYDDSKNILLVTNFKNNQASVEETSIYALRADFKTIEEKNELLEDLFLEFQAKGVPTRDQFQEMVNYQEEELLVG